jgi:hypothetical protein
VLFSNRKAKAQNQKKYEYNAIERCYGSEGVALALCSSQKFVGFNLERSLGNYSVEEFVNRAGASRTQRVEESSFQMHGVVYEQFTDSRHVPCELEISETETVTDTIGDSRLVCNAFAIEPS